MLSFLHSFVLSHRSHVMNGRHRDDCCLSSAGKKSSLAGFESWKHIHTHPKIKEGARNDSLSLPPFFLKEDRGKEGGRKKLGGKEGGKEGSRTYSVQLHQLAGLSMKAGSSQPGQIPADQLLDLLLAAESEGDHACCPCCTCPVWFLI